MPVLTRYGVVFLLGAVLGVAVGVYISPKPEVKTVEVIKRDTVVIHDTVSLRAYGCDSVFYTSGLNFTYSPFYTAQGYRASQRPFSLGVGLIYNVQRRELTPTLNLRYNRDRWYVEGYVSKGLDVIGLGVGIRF